MVAVLTDVERPRWMVGIACEIAGIPDPVAIRLLRKDYGLRIGKSEPGGWRFSPLDVAELCAIPALRVLGFDPGSAVTLARRQLRPNLKDILVNRIVHGFWSLGAVVLGDESAITKRTLYLDAIAERVIDKLKLPLAQNPRPRNTETALRMVDAIFDYIESESGRARWQRWHQAAAARGGNIPIGQAANELGAPAWFLRVLDAVLRSGEVENEKVAKAVRPRASNVAGHLKGVVLQ